LCEPLLIYGSRVPLDFAQALVAAALRRGSGERIE
jgi:hypothetical protein